MSILVNQKSGSVNTALFTVILNALLVVFDPSVAEILKEYVVFDETAGAVPVNAPVDEFNDNQFGRLEEE